MNNTPSIEGYSDDTTIVHQEIGGFFKQIMDKNLHTCIFVRSMYRNYVNVGYIAFGQCFKIV